DVQQRVSLLKEFLPDSVEQTISEADDVLQHRFRLLGYRDLDYSSAIDWHLDAVHGKRAPLKPWYKIRFLDFDEVGDHKVTWELNRHQHLVTLAKAFTFTHDSKYAREIEQQFYSWQAANPYLLGINWGSSLEVAFRSLSWIWVRNLLSANSLLSTEFDRVLHSRTLAACNRLRVPDSFDASLRRMLHVVDVLGREGPAQCFDDDDGGRLFNPRLNQAEHMSDPLVLGACLFEDVSLNSAA